MQNRKKKMICRSFAKQKHVLINVFDSIIERTIYIIHAQNGSKTLCCTFLFCVCQLPVNLIMNNRVGNMKLQPYTYFLQTNSAKKGEFSPTEKHIKQPLMKMDKC